jgi:hypothetical protein
MEKGDIIAHFGGDFTPFYSKYLQKVKKIGGQEFKALCRFHKETDASFNFNSGTGQYFCHGCGKKGDVIHFYAKLHSLDTRCDFGKVLNGIARDFGIRNGHRVKPRMVKAYDYTDAAGQLIFQVCRMEPKDFRQRRPDGKRWAWNLKGVEPVLYRLPSVLAASEVLLVEGEKDADNLAALGFTATTVPGGAGKWRESYKEVLQGKQVVLIPDNDNPGREHMVKIAQSLNGSAAGIKLIELPGLPSKGDVSDFIETFSDPQEAAERLALIIDGAKPYTPPKAVSIEDIVLDVSAFRAIEVEPRGKLLAPFFKTESINQVYGWRGTGKTFIALGFIDAITRRQSFGPWKCEESVPCLFVDGEMTVTDDHERFDDLGFLEGKRESPFYFYSDHYANRLGLPRASLLNATWRDKIKAICKARYIGLLVLDNIASLAPGIDENAKKDWDPINQWLLELRYAGVSTLLLHHESKEGKQRGTSAREDNLDTSIRLKAPPDYIPEDGCRFIVHFAKARVRTTDLKAIADTEFRLIADEAGRFAWTHADVKASTKIEVLRLVNEGVTQKAISEDLAISKGYVSKIIRKAIEEGLINKKGGLTQSGFCHISG